MKRDLKKPPQGLFFTGTDTGVGKTYVACLVARRLFQAGVRVGVYKPAASGCRRQGNRLVAEDAQMLWEAAGCPAELSRVCPQLYEAPLAPHLAARAAGFEIDDLRLRTGLAEWHGQCDLVLVEGAGGLMSPLSDETYNATLAEEFGYPVIVVAPNRLGVINQTLQTLITAAAFGEGLDTAGVVLNNIDNEPDPSRATNRAELARCCVPPVLGEVAHGGDFIDKVDWLALAATASRR
jgi:dethiobiotin synthetase